MATTKVELPVLATIQNDMSDVVKFGNHIAALADSMEITSEESLARANQAIVDLSPRIKHVKERKDFFTKPIKQHVKLIDSFFNNILEPFERADRAIRNKIVQYRLDQQEAQRQVIEILSEPSEDHGQSSPPVVIMPITPSVQKSVRVEGGQVTAAKEWKHEIVDISLIEVEVLREVVNTTRGREALESVIRAHVKAGRRVMAGVRVFESESLSVRS